METFHGSRESYPDLLTVSDATVLHSYLARFLDRIEAARFRNRPAT